VIKNSLAFFIIFLAGTNTAFAQAIPLRVLWNGYIYESPLDKNSDKTSNEEWFRNIFHEAFREHDKDNKYLEIIPAYDYRGILPDAPYKLSGKIEKNVDQFVITTTMFYNNIPEGPSCLDHFDGRRIAPINIIMGHASTIYTYFADIFSIANANNISQALEAFDRDFGQKLISMNEEEYRRAYQQLTIIENKFEKSEKIDEWRHRIASYTISPNLSRANENINTALSSWISNESSEKFYRVANALVLSVRQIIEVSGDTQLLARLREVESKIEKYEEETKSPVYTGGLGLFIEKPLPMMLIGPDIDFQKVFPGILGLNLRYVTSGTLPIQGYVQFSYAGGSMKERQVPYVTDSALHFFSLSTGMHLQFYINKIIAPYGYFGVGYIHLVEYATDDTDSVFLHFPGMIADVGIGTRVHLSPKFALEAKTQWNLIISGSVLMSVNFSLGVSYLFIGKEYIIRR
jgi:hypothetical protein